MVVVSYDNDYEDENHNCFIRYFCCDIYSPRSDVLLTLICLIITTIVIAVTAGVCANSWFIYVNTISNPKSVNIVSNWNDTFNTGSVGGSYQF